MFWLHMGNETPLEIVFTDSITRGSPSGTYTYNGAAVPVKSSDVVFAVFMETRTTNILTVPAGYTVIEQIIGDGTTSERLRLTACYKAIDADGFLGSVSFTPGSTSSSQSDAIYIAILRGVSAIQDGDVATNTSKGVSASNILPDAVTGVRPSDGAMVIVAMARFATSAGAFSSSDFDDFEAKSQGSSDFSIAFGVGIKVSTGFSYSPPSLTYTGTTASDDFAGAITIGIKV